MKMFDTNFKQTGYQEFQSLIWDYYHSFGRIFPWRNINDPYKIIVSEVMLQQTQTYRVLPKYEQFISAFPTFSLLAEASLREVLSVWQGLGYNRRGKYLHELAMKIVNDFGGRVPENPVDLVKLPGVGPATSCSIAAFAFNKPTVFIGTNIRTVFIYYFFKDKNNVHDKEILPLVAQTIDPDNPREWYYALMDYGVMLKQKMVNPSRKSKHHVQQSKFEGSDRQIRGKIIHFLTDKKFLEIDRLVYLLDEDEKRVSHILKGLIKDGMIKKVGLAVSI